MYSRSLRLALLSSLGLLPLGCSRSGAGLDEPRARDASVGDVPEADSGGANDDASRPHQPLAECGQSTPLEADALGGAAPVLHSGIATGISRCESGVLHRPAPVTCSSGLPRPMPSAGDAGSDAAAAPTQAQAIYGSPAGDNGWCASDAECTEHPNGYCAPERYFTGLSFAFSAPRCIYGCLQDADCGDGQFCLCGDPVGACVPAECQSDGECGGDRSCAAFFDPYCNVLEGYACQSENDECYSSQDCASGKCILENGERHCQEPPAASCGRPFLVDGVERLAEARPGAGWAVSAGDHSGGLELSAAQRARAGQHWLHNALMEHASIAAFARFTLQLMHLGAPHDLVVRSQLAMLDETAHAEACFGLASRYLERPLEPGRLAMDAALDERDLEAIVRLAFVEGCVGETVATLEAREALAGARDPEAREALARIAVDEQRHAELAWGFVRWALGQSPDVRALLERELGRLESEARAPLRSLRSRDEAALAEHGVLSEMERERSRRCALAEVVLPCARALLGADGMPGSARIEPSRPGATPVAGRSHGSAPRS